MKSYRELIEQTFEFPQKEFKVRDHELLFNDVPLMDVIKQYGTPLKISYLPRVSENIRFAFPDIFTTSSFIINRIFNPAWR